MSLEKCPIIMTPFKKYKYLSEFYTTFTSQIELLPRITIRYKKFKINLIAIEWLWFGFYIELF
jgi:hypothetical protein